MRAVYASEGLRLLLETHRAAVATDEDGYRYRAQRESDAEVKMRRYPPADKLDEEREAEEIDNEPEGVEWRPA